MLISLPRKFAAVAVAAAMVATLTAVTSNQSADAVEKGRVGAGAKAIAHHAGAKVIKGNNRGPSPRLFNVGMGAGEPTIGATNEGNVFFVALPGTASKVLRSTDDGQKWEDVSPTLPTGQQTHRISLDPYVYVDETEGVDRIFTIDLTVACSYMSYSDDEGETWTVNPLACGRPVNDHQTLFAGPPVSTPTLVYPNLVYYCWNDVASSSCSKSSDGGLTFRPTGFPAYPGVKADDDGGFCGGLHGHGHVGPEGNVYLPREYCGNAYLAISKDEGTTWTNVKVAKMPHVNGADPSVATDRKGNIYYLYVGDDRLPYLVVSKNEGKTWTKPMMVAPPGVNETNLPSIDAAGPGKIALVYYGTENSPFPCKDGCSAEAYNKTTWNGYMTTSANVLDKNPVFYSTTVNAKRDPLKRKTCGPGRCDTTVYDFVDVQIAPNGGVWAAFVDACILVCGTKDGLQDTGKDGIVGHLVGGPGLL